MTNEEAIDLLSEITMYCDFTDEYGDYINDEPYITAVDMAINALETQKGIPVSEKSCNTCGQECAIKYHGCSNWIPNNSEEVNADEDSD